MKGAGGLTHCQVKQVHCVSSLYWPPMSAWVNGPKTKSNPDPLIPDWWHTARRSEQLTVTPKLLQTKSVYISPSPSPTHHHHQKTDQKTKNTIAMGQVHERPEQILLASFSCRVIESRNPEYPVGSEWVCQFGWRTHTICNPDVRVHESPIFLARIYRLPELKDLPHSLGLGTVGMPGYVWL